VIIINNRNYNRRPKPNNQSNKRKTEYEKQRTHEEVQQIKKKLINYAKTSWGKEWINSILKVGRPFRMQRGIEYADDEERIDNLIINKGQIFGTVQGTAPTPYRVKIVFKTIPEDGWEKIVEELSSKIINLINLLEGVLPEEIIDIFERNDYPLFLDAEKDKLNATCSCPDQAVPCKHIAAIILYVARVLDYDPFIILKIRGKSKNDILQKLNLSETLENDILKKESEKISEIQKNVKTRFSIPSVSIEDLSSNQFSSKVPQKVGFQFRKPKFVDTLENLGLPSNLEDPKSFEIVFRAIYSTVTSEIYKKSMKLKKFS
jgi:uncharacterized Zn finger protein